MKFLSRLFKSQDALDALRADVNTRQWARALGRSKGLGDSELDEQSRLERNQLLRQAAAELAALNLDEAEAFVRGQQFDKAREHLDLALPLAGDQADLVSRINALRLALSAKAQTVLPDVPKPLVSKSCSGSCGPVKSQDSSSVDGAPTLDRDIELELVLSSYSPETAKRYLAKSDGFHTAFLLAQAGENDPALAAFDALDASERDDLFFFERGALLLRCGRIEAARVDVETALACDPDSLVSFVTLVDLERHASEHERARELLVKGQQRPEFAPFCHQSLAHMLAQAGKLEEALAEGQKALALGAADAELLELMGSILEGQGELGQAEALFMRIPGGGCGGGSTALALAGFWLRRGKNPDKVVDALNNALKGDPHNPTLLLQLAEAYLLKGWTRQGRKMLEGVLAFPGLDPQLRQRAEQQLAP